MIAAEAANLPATSPAEGRALAAQFWEPFLAKGAVHRVWHPARQH